MANTARQTDTRLAPSDGNNNFSHIVGDAQDRLYRLFGKKPRSLCGLVLNLTPNAPYPADDAPTCPKCVIEMSLL